MRRSVFHTRHSMSCRQVHVTGEVAEVPRNAVFVALQAVFENWERIRACLTKV